MPSRNHTAGLFRAGVRQVGKLSPYLATRVLLFALLMFLGFRAPGWSKGLVWFIVFLVGIWTLLAIIRDSRRFLDFLVVHLGRWSRSRSSVLRGRDRIWRVLRGIAAVVLLGIIIWKSAPIWHYMATTSLVEDEISSVATYTSKGFVPAVTTYKLAKNHILFNVVNSFIPGSSSTFPLRARGVSFLSLIATFVLLVAYAWRRGWLLIGLIGAGLIVANDDAMLIVLQGRGYGMLCFFSMAGCVAFAEWLRTRHHRWLIVLAISCVAGTYTLPFYVVFGGALLLFAFFHRPSRDTFQAGFISVIAIAMLYLPVATSVFGVFTGYDEQYSDTFTSGFSSIKGVFQALQYYIPDNCLQVSLPVCLFISLLSLLYLTVGDKIRRYDRVAFAGVALAILAFFLFCLILSTVPLRVAAFLTAPMGFLVVLAIGTFFDERPFFLVRPIPEIAFVLFGTFLVLRSEASAPSLTKQNWREIGIFIEHAFPPQIRVWTGGNHGKQLQWNLASRRKPEEDDLDRSALSAGKLVAVESAYGSRETARMLRWTDLDENVRFVTYPLEVNYQRVFFTPPSGRNIASIEVNHHPIALHVEGRQPSDPLLLSKSLKMKDVLYNDPAGYADKTTELRFAAPEEIPLPANILVTLENKPPSGTCNLLFTQGLEEKIVSTEVQDKDGEWHQVPHIYLLGELASVEIAQEGCLAIKLHIAAGPHEPILSRPAFGLLDAWFTPH
ncbi:hypothetical protein BH09VER1_BH09VER1_05930 [soil metagenome]